MTNLSLEALRLLHVHAAGGWELVAQHQREAAAAHSRPEDVEEVAGLLHVAWVKGDRSGIAGGAQIWPILAAAVVARYGAPPEPPPSLRTAAAKALHLLDTCGIVGGDIDRAQKLLRDALGEAG
jgi:hypothetical protein